jgi:hypothetical protein
MSVLLMLNTILENDATPPYAKCLPHFVVYSRLPGTGVNRTVMFSKISTSSLHSKIICSVVKLHNFNLRNSGVVPTRPSSETCSVGNPQYIRVFQKVIIH